MRALKSRYVAVAAAVLILGNAGLASAGQAEMLQTDGGGGQTAGALSEPLARGATSLRWSQENLAFHLTGDMAPGEAVGFAQTIAQNFEDR